MGNLVIQKYDKIILIMENEDPPLLDSLGFRNCFIIAITSFLVLGVGR